MQTDWKRVRTLLMSAIDACEALEAAEIKETDRERELTDSQAKLFELVMTAYVMPENKKYEAIRIRHRGGIDNPFVQEASRILRSATDLAAELVGAEREQGARDGGVNAARAALGASVDQMIEWYQKYFIVELRRFRSTQESGRLLN